MSSLVTTRFLDINERFQQKDNSVTNDTFTQQYMMDLLAQAQSEASVYVKADLPGSMGLIPATRASRPTITRRHSSSIFLSNTSKPTSLTPFSESNGLFPNGICSNLQTVEEERGFRHRAFSEGSPALSEALLEQQQTQSATSRYKTELCRPFEENGKCKYGDKCQFAHGKHELRHMVRHPKYKTELCRTYHTSGLCPYGPRCHFIHNQDEPTIGAQRQAAINAMGMQQSAAVPVPISTSIPRQNNGIRPTNLQLISQQRGINRLNSYSYSPPLDASPVFGVNENTILSPIGRGPGQIFNYGKIAPSPIEMPKVNTYGVNAENRNPSPPLTPFDFAHGQLTDLTVHDDSVFELPLTPPDSDRESANGSPPGFANPAPQTQRLPIFKCLSQSD